MPCRVQARLQGEMIYLPSISWIWRSVKPVKTRALGIVAVVCLLAGDAMAHGDRAPQDTSGLSIPFVTHGEMAILASYRTRILALGSLGSYDDRDLHKLMVFAKAQHARCLWTLVPGTLSDEASPFNECGHADLAGTKAVLLRAQEVPRLAARASVLISEIEQKMIMSGATLIGCAYSDSSFNTAEIVGPHWRSVPEHWPSFVSLSSITVALGGFSIAGTISLRRRTKQGAESAAAPSR